MKKTMFALVALFALNYSVKIKLILWLLLVLFLSIKRFLLKENALKIDEEGNLRFQMKNFDYKALFFFLLNDCGNTASIIGFWLTLT